MALRCRMRLTAGSACTTPQGGWYRECGGRGRSETTLAEVAAASEVLNRRSGIVGPGWWLPPSMVLLGRQQASTCTEARAAGPRQHGVVTSGLVRSIMRRHGAARPRR